MHLINTELLDIVTQKARESSRLRMNHNFHTDPSDPINRLLNAMEPGTYVRPHKHETPKKRETFFILRGKIIYIEFSNRGDIEKVVKLSAGEGNFGVEITPGVYHTLIPLETASVLYEIKDGPYDAATDKVFADWAPPEGDEKAKSYLEKLMEELQVYR